MKLRDTHSVALESFLNLCVYAVTADDNKYVFKLQERCSGCTFVKILPNSKCQCLVICKTYFFSHQGKYYISS